MAERETKTGVLIRAVAGRMAVAAMMLFAAAAPAEEPATRPAAKSSPVRKHEDPVADAPTTRPADKKAGHGAAYTVTRIEFRYGKQHPQLPPIGELMTLTVQLGKVADGYIAPAPGVEAVTVRLADVPGLPVHRFYEGAIRSINVAVVRFFNQRKLIGVFVTIDPDDLDMETGEDLRDEGNTVLREVVWVGTVARVRTIASGDRIAKENRIDSPWHESIRRSSPIRPAADGGRNDLLLKDALDRYVYRLNRHPGRRVDVALSSSGEPGEVWLDYLVSENKPWLAYAQLSNTGTSQTGKWRLRFGAVHNQLTGNDDILSVDYSSTIRIDDVHSVTVAYEAPVWRSDWLRWRIGGGYSEYTAADVGLPGATFTGRDIDLGAELIANVFQYKQLFIDLVAGGRWRRVVTNDVLLGVHEEEDFFLPHLEARLSRRTDTAATAAMIRLEGNCRSVGGTHNNGIDDLGRADATSDWWLLRWAVSQSFYLEPLLNPAAWEDARTPESSTLAHEMFFAFSGQSSLGHRLIAQTQEVVGGLYSVRGYAQSEAAGDNGLAATAEYRFHLPRAFGVQKDPEKVKIFGQPFHYARPSTYGRPDWDLIFRTFFDAGRTTIESPLVGEQDQCLMSWGLGLELQVRQNVTFRVDWAQALRDIAGGAGTTAGSHRFHIVLTLLY